MKNLQVGETVFVTKFAKAQGIKTGKLLSTDSIILVSGFTSLLDECDVHATLEEAKARVSAMHLEAITAAQAEVDRLRSLVYIEMINTVSPLKAV